ncbi:MAG: hypothetical protein AAGI34_04115 [Pseudomonadota bacterium]
MAEATAEPLPLRRPSTLAPTPCLAALSAGLLEPALLEPAETLSPKVFRALATALPQEGSAVLRAEGGAIEAVAYLAHAPLSLRIAVAGGAQGDLSAQGLSGLIRLARHVGAKEIRTQTKIAQDSPLARRLTAAGLTEGTHSSVHEIDVARARRVLERFRFAPERIGDARLVYLDRIERAQVRRILDRSGMLDGFEFEARSVLTGEGRIEASESPVLLGEDGIRGFILIARTACDDTRDIAMRWVASPWQGLSLINLCLMRDCLKRAEPAGVVRARFRAPALNSDTLALARRLDGRETGRLCGYAADPQALAPEET